jgi:hypothetical protein
LAALPEPASASARVPRKPHVPSGKFLGGVVDQRTWLAIEENCSAVTSG